ncbi:amidase domain-containing protein [Haloechinothrix halophila]|uniref:amidase domain-containing protein n=1 Tax=Haloechinothrix halophila TaxID=1069073 RepID=UPI0009FDD20D|nr:amidase domain-containing protein [Haloechinothrix halophila]
MTISFLTPTQAFAVFDYHTVNSQQGKRETHKKTKVVQLSHPVSIRHALETGAAHKAEIVEYRFGNGVAGGLFPTPGASAQDDARWVKSAFDDKYGVAPVVSAIVVKHNVNASVLIDKLRKRPSKKGMKAPTIRGRRPKQNSDTNITGQSASGQDIPGHFPSYWFGFTQSAVRSGEEMRASVSRFIWEGDYGADPDLNPDDWGLEIGITQWNHDLADSTRPYCAFDGGDSDYDFWSQTWESDGILWSTNVPSSARPYPDNVISLDSCQANSLEMGIGYPDKLTQDVLYTADIEARPGTQLSSPISATVSLVSNDCIEPRSTCMGLNTDRNPPVDKHFSFVNKSREYRAPGCYMMADGESAPHYTSGDNLDLQTECTWHSDNRPEGDVENPTRKNLETFIMDYRRTIPEGEDTNEFRWDANSEAEIADIVSLMRKAYGSGTESARVAADEALEAYGYELEFMTDTVTERNYLVFYEDNPSRRHWGLYVLRYDTTSSPAHQVVEVPHPVTDPTTADLGAKMFVDVDAKMFAMAGSNRYNSTLRRTDSDGTVYENSRVSDMARSYESLFHKVHTNFTMGDWNSSYYDTVPEDSKPEWSPTHVIQLHGYEDREGRESYPDVVLSNGSCQPHAKLRSFAARLNGRDISADVFEGDTECSEASKNYPDLGATINPQGKHTRKKGGYFYHVEASVSLRANLSRYHLMTKVLGETLFYGHTGRPARIASSPSYDSEAAASYARTYALDYNSNYNSWSERDASEGGDSPNFASQALAAGGWKPYAPVNEQPDDHKGSVYWYYREPYYESTWSWYNAALWNSFAKKSGRVRKINYLSDIEVGDIVQMSLPDSKNYEYRSMIVTGFDDRGPLVSYHSPDRLNVPLWRIVRTKNLSWTDSDGATTHYPTRAFSAWRTVSVSAHNHQG